MSQETKELIDSCLIVPYLRKQSLKSLGDGLDSLCEKLTGLEISQIAFMSHKVFIEEVRLYDTYS